jgi:hypothetical protein
MPSQRHDTASLAFLCALVRVTVTMPSAELNGTAGARPPRQAAAPPVAAPPRARAAHKFGLRAVLTGLVLLTVTLTAILIHLTWFYAARRNVADVVGQLNRQIVGSVQHEVRGTLNNAWSVQAGGTPRECQTDWIGEI